MLMVFAALLAAAPISPPHVPPRPATEVEGITVMPPTPAPKLVTRFPDEGEAVAPGALIVRLTFDQKMLATGFDIAPVAGAEAPDCLKTPRLLDDGKTFVLLCTARAGRTFALSLNQGSASGGAAGGFANLNEHRADPIVLTFTTTRADPVRSLTEAMTVAKLGGLDIPVAVSP